MDTTKPRRKKSVSPTQRTMALLRERGWNPQIVERWNPHAMIRQDLFGWIDIVAMGQYDTGHGTQDYNFLERTTWTHMTGPDQNRIIGIQTCSGASHANRKAKILSLPSFRQWIECGGIALLISWRTLLGKNKDGSRSKQPKWEPRIERLTLADLTQQENQ